MRKFVTFMIIIVSIVAGAMFIKAMMELEREASTYLDSRQEKSDEKSAETQSTQTDKSKLNPDPDLVAGNTNTPEAETLQTQPPTGNLLENVPEDLKDKPKLLVDTLYNDLFSELILNEEELDELKNLIADGQVLTSNSYDSSFNNNDEKIRELLGEQEYELYKEYNETLGHRIKIIQYKQHLAISDITLSEEQQSALLNTMLEEGSDINTLEVSKQFLDAEQIKALEKFQNTIGDTEQTTIESLPEILE